MALMPDRYDTSFMEKRFDECHGRLLAFESEVEDMLLQEEIAKAIFIRWSAMLPADCYSAADKFVAERRKRIETAQKERKRKAKTK